MLSVLLALVSEPSPSGSALASDLAAAAVPDFTGCSACASAHLAVPGCGASICFWLLRCGIPLWLLMMLLQLLLMMLLLLMLLLQMSDAAPMR